MAIDYCTFICRTLPFGCSLEYYKFIVCALNSYRESNDLPALEMIRNSFSPGTFEQVLNHSVFVNTTLWIPVQGIMLEEVLSKWCRVLHLRLTVSDSDSNFIPLNHHPRLHYWINLLYAVSKRLALVEWINTLVPHFYLSVGASDEEIRASLLDGCIFIQILYKLKYISIDEVSKVLQIFCCFICSRLCTRNYDVYYRFHYRSMILVPPESPDEEKFSGLLPSCLRSVCQVFRCQT